jgi:PilZ domain
MTLGEGSAASGRRSERVFLRIPIEVKATDEQGRPFSEKTFTLVINRHGARICSWRALVPESHVMVTNLQTQMSCAFRVVGPVGKSLGEGPEWGVECLEPDRGIWGIYFPPRVDSPMSEAEVDALIECEVCKAREFAKLNIEQYRALRHKGTVQRRCSRCRVERGWRFGSVETESEAGEGRPAEAKNRHRAKRLTVKLPVRIRLQDGREQVSRTENLSRGGVCFVSDLEMQPDEQIRLTVGYEPESDEHKEIGARVVWRRVIEGTKRFAYGVQLEENS